MDIVERGAAWRKSGREDFFRCSSRGPCATLAAYLICTGLRKKKPLTEIVSAKDEYKLSAVPPWFTAWAVRLTGYQHIPDN